MLNSLVRKLTCPGADTVTGLSENLEKCHRHVTTMKLAVAHRSSVPSSRTMLSLCDSKARNVFCQFARSDSPLDKSHHIVIKVFSCHQLIIFCRKELTHDGFVVITTDHSALHEPQNISCGAVA